MTNEELVAEIRKGDAEAIAQLWKQCFGYIKKVAIRWAMAWEGRSDFDEEDLIQSAFFALCKAVEGFQEDKGCSFIYFLDFSLKSEFAVVCGCRTIKQKKDPMNSALSFEFTPQSNGEDKESTLADFVADPNRPEDEIDDAIFRSQCSEVIRNELRRLPEKQEQAVCGYYLDGKTYTKIAEDLQCSSGYVGTLLKEGLRTLRSSATLRILKEDMNYYSDRNLYRNTGYGAWKRTGSSSQELEVIRKEEKKRSRLKAEKKLEQEIWKAMELTGWDYDFVKQLLTA